MINKIDEYKDLSYLVMENGMRVIKHKKVHIDNYPPLFREKKKEGHLPSTEDDWSNELITAAICLL